MFVTSRDNHGTFHFVISYKADAVDLHDMFMIIYLLLNLPWMYLSSINASTSQARRRRQVKRVNPS